MSLCIAKSPLQKSPYTQQQNSCELPLGVSSPCFAESFAGAKLAEFDPANILASPPQRNPQPWRWVKERDYGFEEGFSHRLVGG